MHHSITEKEIINQLVFDAHLYSHYSGTYLTFVHSRSKSASFERTVLFFGPEHFMHLVGVNSFTCSAIEFYKKCLDGSVVIGDCTPTHSAKNREEKIALFPQLFDYSKSKFYKFGNRDLSAYWDDFSCATGNDAGVVGFDQRNERISAQIPVTIIKQPIYKYCSETHKIYAVIQIPKIPKGKETVLYEIKAGFYESFCSLEQT